MFRTCSKRADSWCSLGIKSYVEPTAPAKIRSPKKCDYSGSRMYSDWLSLPTFQVLVSPVMSEAPMR
jgi:hypothetical protein